MSLPKPDAKQIFLTAIEHESPDALAHYLDEACQNDAELRARVEQLIHAHQHVGQFLGGSGNTDLTQQQPIAPARPVSSVVGPYKLLQQIGEGGMGMVYMAEQSEPIQRRVALKLIKPGLDSRQTAARFEAERQALALMDHPNIAKVLDAGTTESGQPYFVMELVHGLPLTKYCDQQRLSPRERLKLFIPVCQAVQHAHQKGVIHRDLKPSNVLVAMHDGQPVPKVIDFGVAKALGQKLTDKTMFTEFGAIVGTLEYMSPEQAEQSHLDVDTRSDIYSLGVMLYELLTGSTPLDCKRLKHAAILELLRIIKDEEPQKPSTRLSTTDALPSIAANRSLEPNKLSGLVRGELDWIVMKALEKDRNRRYETANGFAADVQRYLQDEPVTACPPSASYRFRKFARRNKAALFSASLVSLALLSGTIVSLFFAIQSRQRAIDANVSSIAASKSAADAELQKSIAQEKERVAEANALLARRRFYSAQINLAWQAWKMGDLPRVLELLESQRPGSDKEDLRTFEWHHLWRLCQPGHLQTIKQPIVSRLELGRQAVFLPDGKTILTGGTDLMIRLCDISTGQEKLRFGENTKGRGWLAVSPDGSLVAQAAGVIQSQVGQDTQWHTNVILREVATGKELWTAQVAGGVWSLEFSPDGTRLATSAELSPKIEFLDVATGTRVSEVPNPFGKGGVVGVAYSPTGKLLAVFGGGGEVWNLEANPPQLVWSLAGARAIAFSPDGETLASAGNDKVTIWNISEKKEFVNYSIGSSIPPAVAYSPDGKKLAISGGNTRTAIVIDLVSGHKQEYSHLSATDGVAFSQDSKSFASCSLDGDVKLWNLAADREPLEVGLSHLGGVLSRDGRMLALPQSQPPGIQLFDLATREVRRTLPAAHVDGVAISPDGRLVASGARFWGKRLDIQLWDATTGAEIAVLNHNMPPWNLTFSLDGKTLAVGCGFPDEGGGEVCLWDVAERRLTATIGTRQINRVQCVSFSPDGTTLAVGTQFGRVLLFDTTTGKERLTLRGRTAIYEWTPSLAFSADGSLLAAGSATGEIDLWDTTTGQQRGQLRGHTSAVRALAFLPDGKTLLSRDGKGAIKFWDSELSQERFTSEGHSFFGLSSSGNTLIVGDRDGRVRLWRGEVDLEPTRPTAKAEQDLQLSHDDQELTAALAKLPVNIDAFHTFATLLGQQKAARAIKAYTAALEQHPEMVELWLARARYHVDDGNVAEADADYKKAATLSAHELNKFIEAGWWAAATLPSTSPPFPPWELNASTPVAGAKTAVRPFRVSTAPRLQQVEFRDVPELKDAKNAYAMTCVYSPGTKAVTLLIGGTQLAEVSLNGRRIYQWKKAAYHYNLERVPVLLRPGRNILVARVSNPTLNHSFILRIGDNRLDRGLELARFGQWEEAVVLMKTEFAQAPYPGAQAWNQFSGLQPVTGDLDGYREFYRQTLNWIDIDRSSDNYVQGGYACTVASVPDADALRLVKLVDEGVAKNPGWPADCQPRVYYRAGRYQEVLDRIAIRGGLRWSTLRALCHHQLGNAEQATSELDRAERDFSALVTIEGDDPATARVFGYFHGLLDIVAEYAMLREARSLMKPDLSQDDAALKALQAAIARQLKAADPELLPFEMAVIYDAKNPRRWLDRARARTELGKWELAQADFAKAIAMAPGDFELLTDRARTYAELNRPKEAAADFVAVLNNQSQEPQKPELVSAHQSLCTLIAQWPEVFEIVTTLLPDNHSLWLDRARDHVAHQRWKEAASDYRRAEKKLSQPGEWLESAAAYLLAEDAEAHASVCGQMLDRYEKERSPQLGSVLALAYGLTSEPPAETERLVEWAQSSATADPKNSDFAFALGLAHFRAGNTEQALSILDTVRTSDAALQDFRQVRAAFVVALAQRQLGLLLEAAELFQRASQAAEQFRQGTTDESSSIALADRFMLLLLRREAETALSSASAPDYSTAPPRFPKP